MESKKSGIDMLEELLYKLATIEKRLDIMDLNIKTIANGSKICDEKSINKPKEKQAGLTAEAVVAPEKGFKNFNFEPTDAAKLKKPVTPKRAAVGSIMVKGKLKIDKAGKPVPLPGILIKIYDSQDKMVKQTKTNRAGHWMSQLPTGKYVALLCGTYDGQPLQQQNINFEVPKSLPPGKTEIEVM